MKTTKEKILFGVLIVLGISFFVLLWIWASSLANGAEKEGFAYAGFIVYLALMVVNNLWIAERDKRRIIETTDKIMDMIMEFHKENKKVTMTVEKGLGKTKNFKNK